MENKDKKRIYYILKVHCHHCGGYREARSNLPRGAFGGMKCKCGKMLAPGYMGWEIIGKIKARGDFEALNIYGKQTE
jgi:hypothetical protein